MRMLHTAELPKLMSNQAGPCVSVYLGTRGNGSDPQTLNAKWNGLVREADSILKQNFSGHRARFLMEPMRSAPAIISNPKKDMHGVALFRSFTTAGYYPVMEQTSDLVTVADTFHLKPLLEVIQDQDRYFALALSQKRISLFKGGRKGLRLVETYDAGYGEREGRSDVGARGTIDVPRGKRGRDNTVHFRPLDRVSRFIELTEPYIANLLQRESSSLILVGTPFMHRLYRKVNTYPYVAENGVLASVTHDKEVIHQRTWPVAERILLRQETLMCERYFEEAYQGKASDELSIIAEAAIQGRVASLLISGDARKFGLLNREKGLVALSDRSEGALGDDVLDDIAQEVIQRKGQAFVLPQTAMPTTSPIAAILRW